MHNRGISEIIFQRAAENLRNYTSTLPPTNTGVLVRDFLNKLLAPFLDSRGEWKSTTFYGLLSELSELCLLDYDEQGNSYYMSTSIKASIQDTQIPDQEFTCRIATHLLAVAVDPHMNHYRGEQLFRRLIAPHVDCVLMQGQNVSLDEAARFALVYVDNNRFEEAVVLQKSVFELRRKIFGESHPFTLEAEEQLSSIYRTQSKEIATSLSNHEYLVTRTDCQLSRVS